MSKNAKKFAIGTIIAAIAGFVAGILTAPKSGKETRDDIKNVAVDTKNAAEKNLKKVITEATDLIEQANSKKTEYQGKAKEEYNELVDKTNQVKQKARELISAIHEGDADDKDLKKVITEAAKALKHLKAFLAK
jgi:gas vesicle protein